VAFFVSGRSAAPLQGAERLSPPRLGLCAHLPAPYAPWMGHKTLAELTADPFLRTLEGRDPATPLTAGQAAGFLITSTSTLKEWRDSGKWPPEWFKDEDCEGVRYPLGSLRQYVNDRVEATRQKRARSTEATPAPPLDKTSAAEKIKQIAGKDAVKGFGLDDLILRGGRRKNVKQDTHSQFMALGASDDEWVFLMVPSTVPGVAARRPIDLIASLDMDPDTLEDAECVQLSLFDYSDALARFFREEFAARRFNASLEGIEDLPAGGRKPPRS